VITKQMSKATSAGLKNLLEVANLARKDFQEAFAEVVKEHGIPDGSKVDFNWTENLLLIEDPAPAPEAPKPLEVVK
jgi:hypothetical protein